MTKQKSIYRVFDWDLDGFENYFDTLKEAQENYAKCLKENPQGNWRLYRDTEKPYQSGNFTEECLMFNERK